MPVLMSAQLTREHTFLGRPLDLGYPVSDPSHAQRPFAHVAPQRRAIRVGADERVNLLLEVEDTPFRVGNH